MTKSRFKYRKINLSKKSRKRKNKRTSNIKGGHIPITYTPPSISFPPAPPVMIDNMNHFLEEASRINTQITSRLATGLQLGNQEIMAINNMKTLLTRMHITMSNYDFHDKEEYLKRISNLIGIFTKHQNDILTANVNALTQEIRRFISELNNHSEKAIKDNYFTIKRYINEDFGKIDNMNKLVNADRDKDALKMIYDELNLELQRVTEINKKTTLNKSRV